MPTLKCIEREHILARLEHFGFNKTTAAKSLGISLKTLYNRLAQYDVALPARKPGVRRQRPSRTRVSTSASDEKAAREADTMIRALVTAPLARAVDSASRGTVMQR